MMIVGVAIDTAMIAAIAVGMTITAIAGPRLR